MLIDESAIVAVLLGKPKGRVLTAINHHQGALYTAKGPQDGHPRLSVRQGWRMSATCTPHLEK